MIKKSIMLIGVIGLALLMNSSLSIAQQNLVIAGTGDSQVILRYLGKAFEILHPGVSIKIPNSIGSGGGVNALIKGNADLARTARPLKKKERPGMVTTLFAISPVVFVAHPSVQGLSNLTIKEILGIYRGQNRNWAELGGPNHQIFVINREKGDSSRKVLERVIPEFRTIPSIAKIFYTTPTAMQAITTHPYTFGYLPLSIAKDNPLKIFSVDGIAPELEIYPYQSSFYLISKGEPAGIAKQFIDFLFSTKAKQMMKMYGVKAAEPILQR